MIRAPFVILAVGFAAMFSGVCFGTDDPIRLTPEQEARFKTGLKDPHVQFVRNVINRCLEEKFKSENCEPFISNNVPTEDLSGKFTVYWTEPRMAMGGFGIAIIFLKNPRKIYNAIVFGSEQPYRLHDFHAAKFSEEKMKQIHNMMSYILSREDLAI